jgi:hypothetical protein
MWCNSIKNIWRLKSCGSTLVSDGIKGHGDGVKDIVDGSIATLMKG